MNKVELSNNSLKIASSRYFMNGEDWEKCVNRVTLTIASSEENNKRKYQDLFQEMIYNMDFIPGGRILRNCGRPSGSLLNCYVVPKRLFNSLGRRGRCRM